MQEQVMDETFVDKGRNAYHNRFIQLGGVQQVGGPPSLGPVKLALIHVDSDDLACSHLSESIYHCQSNGP